MTTIIKLGGSLLDDPVRRARALHIIVDRWHRGERVVLVHGGGKHVDAALAKVGIPKRTHAGLRITDDATLEIVVSVLGGSVNKMLVAELTALGVRCAGVSGCDGATLVADRHEPIDGVDLGHVGRVTGSNRMLVRALLTSGIMPVISTVAQGPNGTLLNVNADSGAAAIAVAHGASMLHFITDVPGLLDASGNVVARLTAKDAHALVASGVVSGGMRPKLQAALTALEGGVAAISIGEEGGTNLVAA
ncbi:MAG TPA: acetylglutamate kinase [Thermoanaerobaculia bacterium]|nr:acetylglutamate kinase [Thermoanaerobaculia bacterium]